jgi:predicted SAM-dependent methyltransferase
MLKKTLQLVRSLFYVGHIVKCPICNRQFRAFIKFGNGRTQCPGCGSVERQRALWLYLLEQTDFFAAPQRVLHFAPEPCLFTRMRVMKNLDYHGADLAENLALERVDITSIPYPGESFDIVLCSHVLEHVKDDRGALAEIWRVLAPGGYAVIQLPVDTKRETTFEPEAQTAQERLRLFGQADHVRIYGTDINARMMQAGFTVKIINYADFLSREQRHYYGLEKDTVLYICKKQDGMSG